MAGFCYPQCVCGALARKGPEDSVGGHLTKGLASFGRLCEDRVGGDAWGLGRGTELAMGETTHGEAWGREVVGKAGKNRGPRDRLGEGSRVQR